MNLQNVKQDAQKAWVVFSSNTDLPWLRILKPGFRHCSVLMNDGQHWITFDPLSNYTDIMVHNMPTSFDLPLWLKDRGHNVVPAKIDRKKRAAPWMFCTCVESVKRVLGIHDRLILTPWQLYKHLTQSTNFQIDRQEGDFAWEV